MGGVGKSSLADAIASRAVNDEIVRDIVFVRFTRDAAESEHLTFERCTEALRARLRLNSDAAIPDALRKRPYLIYLDNLETAAEPQDALVARLCDLVENTDARVLLTSRQVYADRRRVFAKRLTGIDRAACRDLVQHVGAHIPGVASMSENDADAIFSATGGVPLAVRLVVPQLEIDSLDGVLERLRLAPLAQAGELEDDEYRQFYRAVLDWSWNAVWNLGEKDGRGLDAGRVLVYLADLPPTPSGSVDASELGTLIGLERSRVKRAVDLLFRFSLVEVSIPPELRAERRYFLHPLVLQYARADLLDTR
jgi:hypothetical protein